MVRCFYQGCGWSPPPNEPLNVGMYMILLDSLFNIDYLPFYLDGEVKCDIKERGGKGEFYRVVFFRDNQRISQ